MTVTSIVSELYARELSTIQPSLIRSAGSRQVIVKRFPTTVPYVAGMSNVGLIEIIFMFLIPLAALWVVIYTAVRAAIRHSR
ncbi:hypothetical protein [Nonomuraea sp. CA-141351]|uniref:hypothetical protein n=1 Tax=Nonomuraea sp. CA-141351 TaxID=3239996 RepID=UPI003D93D9F4